MKSYELQTQDDRIYKNITFTCNNNQLYNINKKRLATQQCKLEHKIYHFSQLQSGWNLRNIHLFA